MFRSCRLDSIWTALELQDCNHINPPSIQRSRGRWKRKRKISENFNTPYKDTCIRMMTSRAGAGEKKKFPMTKQWCSFQREGKWSSFPVGWSCDNAQGTQEIPESKARGLSKSLCIMLHHFSPGRGRARGRARKSGKSKIIQVHVSFPCTDLPSTFQKHTGFWK